MKASHRWARLESGVALHLFQPPYLEQGTSHVKQHAAFVAGSDPLGLAIIWYCISRLVVDIK